MNLKMAFVHTAFVRRKEAKRLVQPWGLYYFSVVKEGNEKKRECIMRGRRKPYTGKEPSLWVLSRTPRFIWAVDHIPFFFFLTMSVL